MSSSLSMQWTEEELVRLEESIVEEHLMGEENYAIKLEVLQSLIDAVRADKRWGGLK